MLIAVGIPKGGAGKSTIATNLAAARASKGYRVKLVDADRQESSYAWGTLRRDDNIEPEIFLAKLTGNIYADLVDEKNNYDTVICDVGGRDGPELRLAMAACDVLVMPILTGQFDTWAFGSMIKMIRDLRNSGHAFRTLAVINSAPPNPQSKEVQDSREMLAELSEDFGLCSRVIVNRQAFRNAARAGRGVVELTGGLQDAKATEEIMQLYREVFNDE